jgi:hypothetical protein
MIPGRDAQLQMNWLEPRPPTVDVNLIRVGGEPNLVTDELLRTLPVIQWICFRMGLNVGTVKHFRIGSSQAGALEMIDNLAEADELRDRWSVRNDALDVFVVCSMNVLDGWSTIGGDRDFTMVCGVFSPDGASDAGRRSDRNAIVYGWHGTSASSSIFSPTGQIRPQVAALLASQARAGGVEIDSLEPAAYGELRAIAYGAAHPKHRVRAMTLLAKAKPGYGGKIFRAALRDNAADVTVRAAAATWLSQFATEDAQPALLAALGTERSATVRHKIVAGLARMGEEDALPALSDLVRSDPDLAVHATFAQSVIAHRLGVGGYEPPTAEESPLAPAPPGARVSHALEAYETIPNGTYPSDNTYGLIVGPSVAGLRCGGRRLAVAIDLTALARLLTTPTIAGLVATKVESDGSLQTSMLVLCWPASDNTAHVAVHRPSGTPAFAGLAKVTGSSVTFRLTAVRAPGARHATVEGTIISGILKELTIRTGSALPPQIPEPM